MTSQRPTVADIVDFLNTEADPNRRYVIGPGRIGAAYSPGVWPDNLFYGETLVAPKRTDGRPWNARLLRAELREARRASDRG